jgi:hypothetical protein
MTGTTVDPVLEIEALIARFGPSLQPSFDGTSAACPACDRHIGHLALMLDRSGWDQLTCETCGAILAP